MHESLCASGNNNEIQPYTRKYVQIKYTHYLIRPHHLPMLQPATQTGSLTPRPTVLCVRGWVHHALISTGRRMWMVGRLYPPPHYVCMPAVSIVISMGGYRWYQKLVNEKPHNVQSEYERVLASTYVFIYSS
jgi:hypothetical protein